MSRMTRKRAYFTLMGTCVGLITLAWLVVRLFSVTAAIIMSVIAMVIPPFAVVIGNTGDPDDPV
jgi:O-antigen/teichoic acid export membrane protein